MRLELRLAFVSIFILFISMPAAFAHQCYGGWKSCEPPAPYAYDDDRYERPYDRGYEGRESYGRDCNEPCGVERERLRQRAAKELERYEACGTWCWMDRFKHGYCGHGCDFYRDHPTFDTEYVPVERPRWRSFKDAPQPQDDDRRYSGGYDEPAPYDPNGHGYERDFTPYRPFQGPDYPPR